MSHQSNLFHECSKVVCVVYLLIFLCRESIEDIEKYVDKLLAIIKNGEETLNYALYSTIYLNMFNLRSNANIKKDLQDKLKDKIIKKLDSVFQQLFSEKLPDHLLFSNVYQLWKVTRRIKVWLGKCCVSFDNYQK